jgi:hypothetical protein
MADRIGVTAQVVNMARDSRGCAAKKADRLIAEVIRFYLAFAGLKTVRGLCCWLHEMVE